MTIPQAIAAGLAGEKISRAITGTSEVSAGRSLVATGSGALFGAAAAGTVVVGATALGITAVATAPITIPLAAASGTVAFIRSLWD